MPGELAGPGTRDAMSEARVIALGVWASGHQDRCGCEEPDGPMCAHPVPFEHTEAEMRRALDG